MKKEDLIKENAKLTQTNKEWSDADLQRRTTLSVMLNAPYKEKGAYDYTRERIIYSWPEIYFALGKLVAKRDHADFVDTIERHERDISGLLKWIDEKKDQLL